MRAGNLSRAALSRGVRVGGLARPRGPVLWGIAQAGRRTPFASAGAAPRAGCGPGSGCRLSMRGSTRGPPQGVDPKTVLLPGLCLAEVESSCQEQLDAKVKFRLGAAELHMLPQRPWSVATSIPCSARPACCCLQSCLAVRTRKSRPEPAASEKLRPGAGACQRGAGWLPPTDPTGHRHRCCGISSVFAGTCRRGWTLGRACALPRLPLNVFLGG